MHRSWQFLGGTRRRMTPLAYAPYGSVGGDSEVDFVHEALSTQESGHVRPKHDELMICRRAA
jgi:hypothetical protein